MKVHTFNDGDLVAEMDLVCGVSYFERLLGMATGRVRAGFLYIRTRPAGPTPKPELAPFNKRVFFFKSKPAPSGPVGPRGLRQPLQGINPWPYNHKKKKKKKKTFPFKHRITQTQTHRFETQSYKKKKRVSFQTQNHKLRFTKSQTQTHRFEN